jgi:hypothetical protein
MDAYEAIGASTNVADERLDSTGPIIHYLNLQTELNSETRNLLVAM